MPRLGVLSKLYVDTNPLTATNPNWVVLPLISDCTVSPVWDEGDASTRESRVKQMEPTLLGLEITGKVRVKNNELYAAYTAMVNGFYQDVAIRVLALNGALNEDTAEGFTFLGKVFNWSEDQSLGSVLYKDFTIKPCIPNGISAAHFPRRALVSGGVLTYLNLGQGGN